MDAELQDLPQDHESLEAMIRSPILEREQQKQRAEQESRRADDLQLENLRLQLELDRYKKWYYGPCADRLATSGEVAQILLEFAEQLEAKPIHCEDVPAQTESEYELRRVKRCKGRRHLANFENLPVTTKVYELNAEERLCPCCGVERKEIGADESWQIEYIPGRFEQQETLNAKLRGHYQYYGRPTNYRSIWQFYRRVRRIWREWLSRRTRGKRLTWERYKEILRQYPLLPPRITHAWRERGVTPEEPTAGNLHGGVREGRELTGPWLT